ncbi:MAG: DUF1559 domain-containing protein, partial [Planctomycetaceae bacterium]|nr:DUF1559 domain-containing protein [Planctomycetaceae bacterium]
MARSDSEVPTARYTLDASQPTLGSAHSGVVNVLLGDGSVRGVTKNVNVNLVGSM